MNRALPMGSGPRPINNGLDLQTRDAQKRAMEMAMKAQLLEIAAPIYSGLLSRPGVYIDSSHREAIRSMADASWKAVIYLAQSAGLIQVNDEELWKDEQQKSEQAIQDEPRGY